jgi:multidrug efflux pump subunit AcrA (membrane-fusion protein)
MPEFLQHYYIEKPVGAVLTAHGRMNSPPHHYCQLLGRRHWFGGSMNANSLLLVLMFIGLCSSIQAAEPTPVRTQTLAQLAIYPESAAPAVAVSLNNSAVAAQVDALVLDLPVRVGDNVKAGAVLVQLSCRDFELDRARLQAEKSWPRKPNSNFHNGS